MTKKIRRDQIKEINYFLGLNYHQKIKISGAKNFWF